MQENKNDINFLVLDDCWFAAPAERTPHFTAVYSEVSRDLQQGLRDLLPGFLFSDLQRFENLEDGYPLMVYHASRPCASRGNFSYDVLDRKLTAKFFRIAERRLKNVLTETSTALSAAGLHQIAALYHPNRAANILKAVRLLRRFRKPLNQMLVSEAHLVNELIRLGGCGACPPRVRARKSALFIKEWNQTLRRFYGKRDFTDLAAGLLSRVTRTLLAARCFRDPDDDAFEAAA